VEALKARIIKENRDGSIILEFSTCEKSGKSDLKKWILSFGKDAKVFMPEELKKEVIKEIIEVAKNITS